MRRPHDRGDWTTRSTSPTSGRPIRVTTVAGDPGLGDDQVPSTFTAAASAAVPSAPSPPIRASSSTRAASARFSPRSNASRRCPDSRATSPMSGLRRPTCTAWGGRDRTLCARSAAARRASTRDVPQPEQRPRPAAGPLCEDPRRQGGQEGLYRQRHPLRPVRRQALSRNRTQTPHLRAAEGRPGAYRRGGPAAHAQASRSPSSSG